MKIFITSGWDLSEFWVWAYIRNKPVMLDHMVESTGRVIRTQYVADELRRLMRRSGYPGRYLTTAGHVVRNPHARPLLHKGRKP